jgi:tetratricopeptide (TPR) repeat protein
MIAMTGTIRKSLVLLFLSLILVPAVHAEDCTLAASLVDEAQQLISTDISVAEARMYEATALCSRSSSLHYNLGVLLYSSKKKQQAQSEFEEALRLKPENGKAMSALATVLFEKGGKEYQHSLQLARKAVELEPDNRLVRETLVQIEASVDVPLVTATRNEDAIAVVIGNRNYSAAGIPDVEYANNDAEIVKKYLIESLGFNEKNILFRLDAKYTQMLTIFGDSYDYKGLLYNFTRQGKSDIFVFYSGHGAPDTNTKKAYLAPVDLNPSAIKHTSYSLDQLYDNLAKLARDKQTRSVTIVLDACFSGATDKGMIIKNASPITLEVTQPILAIKNGAILTSSKGDQISSWYPEQKHGLFTYHFLKAMRDILSSGTPLTIGNIENRLSATNGINDTALRIYSREQMPQVIGNKNISLTNGI